MRAIFPFVALLITWQNLYPLSGYPAGFATMVHPELLPLFHPYGTVTKQFISFDPTGGNNARWSRYRDPSGEHVMFDEMGPGCLYRQQINVWHNDGVTARIRYYFDDDPQPRIDAITNDMFAGYGAMFKAPLCFSTYDFANLYHPMPFNKRLRITISSDLQPGSWYQYTYLVYPEDSGEVVSWRNETAPDTAVARQWANAGSDPKDTSGSTYFFDTTGLAPGDSHAVFTSTGQGAITSLKFSLEPYSAETFFNLILRIYWDSSASPAVNIPVGCFFGSGVTVPGAWQTARSNLMYGFSGTTHSMYCYWPMPYWSAARIVLINQSSTALTSLKTAITCNNTSSFAYPRGRAGHFSAKRTVDTDAASKPYLVAFQEKGHGQVVGKSFFSDNFDTDGDEFTYFDGSRTPQIHGDGIEDDHNQGYSGGPYQQPLWGSVSTGYNGAYRLYLNDGYIFYHDISIRSESRYTATTSDVVIYYYLSPMAADTLRLTDSLDVGNSASEASHGYSVSGQTWSGSISGSYDAFERDRNYYPATDDGRAFRDSSAFTLSIAPDNSGVKLRRRISRIGHAVQTAAVRIDGALLPKPWHVVTFGTADVNTWQDADYEIPAVYTHGKSNFRVSIQYQHDAQTDSSLNAPNALPELNEFFYWAFAYPEKALSDTASPSSPQNPVASVLGIDRIRLTWSLPSIPASYYRIYRDGKPMAITRGHSYLDSSLVDDTEYAYQVSAVSSTDVESPRAAFNSVSTLADETPPSITRVSTIEDTGFVRVFFSEPLEKTSAENILHYAIQGKGSPVSAKLDVGNPRLVTLFFNDLASCGLYRLSVLDITDRARTPNTTAAGLYHDFYFTPFSFVSADSATQGDWPGHYGQNGFNLAAGTDSLGFVVEFFPGISTYTWIASTSESRALLKTALSSDRIAACWHSGSFALHLDTSRTHKMSFYVVDWDSIRLTGQFIQVFDGENGKLLDSRKITNYKNGVYVTYRMSGRKIISLVPAPGSMNAVISGIFMDTDSCSGLITETKQPSLSILPSSFDLSVYSGFGSAFIRYAVPEKAPNLRIALFDIRGRLLQTMVNGESKPGYHEIRFNGRQLATGLVFVRMTTPAFAKTKPLAWIQ